VQYAWTCRCCGKQFDTLPLDFFSSAPDQWLAIPEAERETRGKADSDVCIIDKKDIFVRGCLEIPIVDRDEKFIYGVWVSVSKESFRRILDLWQAEVIENEPPRFVWLCTNISGYPPTMSLKTHVHLRGGGIRPFIELEPTEHPLSIEQREGISLQRVEEIVTTLLPRH
jgi:hypothetical protein